MGSKAPNVGDEFKWRMMVKHESQSLSLFCLAQAYPVPMFRYVGYSISKFKTVILINKT